MKSVRVQVRSTTSRVSFRFGAYTAVLEEESDDRRIVGIAPGNTWAAAAAAALQIADARGYIVYDRPLIQRRVAREGGAK